MSDGFRTHRTQFLMLSTSTYQRSSEQHDETSRFSHTKTKGPGFGCFVGPPGRPNPPSPTQHAHLHAPRSATIDPSLLPLGPQNFWTPPRAWSSSSRVERERSVGTPGPHPVRGWPDRRASSSCLVRDVSGKPRRRIRTTSSTWATTSTGVASKWTVAAHP